jgi:hypothetical protein
LNHRVSLPFLVFAGLVLLTGLACGINYPFTPSTKPPLPSLLPTEPPSPTQPPPLKLIPTQQATLPPLPTLEPSETPTPTESPSFFTEDFQGDLSMWTYFVKSGDKEKLTISTDQGGIVTRLDDVDLAVYFYYDPHLYNDVVIDMSYRNQGRNSNNVNLICRYSDAGWYEFTVQNDGLYQIWAYSNGYELLANGGSTAIRMGQDSNQISVACVGNKLSLSINGIATRTINDTRFFLGQGKVGFGVNISALNPVTPVIVSFDSFTIAQP